MASNFVVAQSVMSRLYQMYQQMGGVVERRGRGAFTGNTTSAVDDRYVLWSRYVLGL